MTQEHVCAADAAAAERGVQDTARSAAFRADGDTAEDGQPAAPSGWRQQQLPRCRFAAQPGLL